MSESERRIRRGMGGGRSNGGCNSNSNSSGEEDGDAEWRAAIDSVTASSTVSQRDANGFPSSSTHQGEENHRPQNMKHYQIKAQKLLDDILGQTIEVVANASNGPDKDPTPNDADAGVRLFKRAPCGIAFDRVAELHGPAKKPKILPGEEIDEKSKKFRKQLQSVVVDGADIIDAAKTAHCKSLARLEAKEAFAKAAAKREEERIQELKKIRGERWLPSIAREITASNPRNRYR